MKRFIIIGIVVAAFTAALAATVRLVPRLTMSSRGDSQAAAQVQRRPPESVELAAPAMSPDVITPDIPTFVTFTGDFSQIQDLKRPKLQFFDPAKGKWRTIGRLNDDGKAPDEIAGDRIFTLRIRLLDQNGTTEIALPKKSHLKTKGMVPSPAQVRLSARKQGGTGLVVSPSVLISTVAPAPVVFGGGSAGPQASVDVPASFQIIDASDPTHVVLEKTGTDGYRVDIVVGSNAENFSLEQYILKKAFGWSETSSPPTLAEDTSTSDITPLTVGGLAGLRLITRDEHQKAVHVFLDDPTHQRVFWFSAFGTGVEQQLHLDDNLTEALSIVQSLQP